jgi:putative Mg2+ transporter-C (MgtC) family protein
MDPATTPIEDPGLVTAGLRLLAATTLSGLIGLEREAQEKPAGLRTSAMIGLAAALITIATLKIGASMTVEEVVVADPVRAIQAVTAGVAFIAAGAVIAKGGEVRGLTTGAALWLSGAVGLACGAGFFGLATTAALIGLVILLVLRALERAFGLKSKDEF